MITANISEVFDYDGVSLVKAAVNVKGTTYFTTGVLSEHPEFGPVLEVKGIRSRTHPNGYSFVQLAHNRHARRAMVTQAFAEACRERGLI